MSKETIVVIEDDRDVADLIRDLLGRQGYDVHVANEGADGLDLVLRNRPDAVLLDLVMPGLDGLDICKMLRGREEGQGVGILMLTGKADEADVVIGLELGADDYVTKPFSPRELLARVRAVLRRRRYAAAAGSRTRVTVRDLVVDRSRHEVKAGGELIPLTRAEFRLLWALVEKPGRVFTRGLLAERITAGSTLISDRNVDVHVSALRKKLGRAGAVIQTVRGIGYKCAD